MRICCVTETMIAGVGRHVVDLIEELVARRHEIHLLYSPLRAEPGLIGRMQTLLGARCHPIPIRRRPGPSDVVALWNLARYVRRHGPFDVIHGHSSKGGALARLLKPVVGGTCVYTAHAFITLSPAISSAERLGYHVLERLLSTVTDQVICTSQFELAHARKLGISDRKLIVIENGIAPGAIERPAPLRARLGIPDDVMIVGFAGRLDDQKSPAFLIEAAAQAIAVAPNVHLVMIGEGPHRARLEALVARHRMERQVTWLGAVRARDCMAGFDALALPSRYEGFPYVLLEALQAGLPILATPVGGVAETVEHGVNGYVVSLDDPTDMARRIIELATDPTLRRQMAQEALRRAADHSSRRMGALVELAYAAPREFSLLLRKSSGRAGS